MLTGDIYWAIAFDDALEAKDVGTLLFLVDGHYSPKLSRLLVSSERLRKDRAMQSDVLKLIPTGSSERLTIFAYGASSTSAQRGAYLKELITRFPDNETTYIAVHLDLASDKHMLSYGSEWFRMISGAQFSRLFKYLRVLNPEGINRVDSMFQSQSHVLEKVEKIKSLDLSRQQWYKHQRMYNLESDR